jgi:hypothetical protein
LPVDKFERLPQGVPIKAALGEVTGHSHQVSGDISCALMRPRTNEAEPLTNFVGVGPNGAVITHEEHSAIELPPDGNYRFLIQTEHVPGEVPRNVAD